MRLPRAVDVAELRAAAAAQPPRRPIAGWPLALLALGVAVGAALVVGWAWFALTRPGPAMQLPASSSAAHVEPQAAVVRGSDRIAWVDVLTELDARRSAALGSGSTAMLEAVYAEGSAALAEEQRRLDELLAAGVTVRGLAHSIVSAEVTSTGPGSVVLAVRDEMAAYELVDASGDVVARRPARGARQWLITLVPTPTSEGEWRISSVQPA